MKTTARSAGTVTLGGDLTVNRLGFGAMRLCGEGVWGPPVDEGNALEVLRRAVQLGVNFVDTAEAYGPEVNERQISQALYPYPRGLVIATKGGTTRSGPGVWGRDCRPERIRELCDGSLARLHAERIDLYQLHAVDEKVPIEEQIGALADLKKAGKIRHAGLSNVDLAQLKRAETIMPIVSVQNRYNLGHRLGEDVLDYCEGRGIVFIPWFPLGAGDVSGMKALESVAPSYNATPHQIAIAWLLKRSPVMLPIPGTKSLQHLEENVAAGDIKLSEEDFTRLG
ncbi:MAG: aldo/keto reductase [Candidatus Eremiobacteraeota bacterium]|nr:aldo/keto reductase [Candidatus Eremiobacteraeota bacterium]